MKVTDPFPARQGMAAQVPGGVAVGEPTDVTMELASRIHNETVVRAPWTVSTIDPRVLRVWDS